MYRCQRLVHPSKQFWNWVCVMAFRAAVVLLLMSQVSSKCLPFNISFIFGYRRKSLGARSGEYAGCSNTVTYLIAKNSSFVLRRAPLGPFLHTPFSCQDLQLRFSKLFLGRRSLALLCSLEFADDIHAQFDELLQCFLQFCLLLAVLIFLCRDTFSSLKNISPTCKLLFSS